MPDTSDYIDKEGIIPFVKKKKKKNLTIDDSNLVRYCFNTCADNAHMYW